MEKFKLSKESKEALINAGRVLLSLKKEADNAVEGTLFGGEQFCVSSADIEDIAMCLGDIANIQQWAYEKKSTASATDKQIEEAIAEAYRKGYEDCEKAKSEEDTETDPLEILKQVCAQLEAEKSKPATPRCASASWGDCGWEAGADPMACSGGM